MLRINIEKLVKMCDVEVFACLYLLLEVFLEAADEFELEYNFLKVCKKAKLLVIDGESADNIKG